MNNTLRLAAMVLLSGSAAHAATQDLGTVHLSYPSPGFTSQTISDVDASYLQRVQPPFYWGPAESAPISHAPLVTAHNTIELSPLFNWTYYSPEPGGFLSDEDIPGFGSAEISAKSLELQADNGWAIRSITWTVEGKLSHNAQASITAQGGSITSTNTVLPAGTQVSAFLSETPLNTLPSYYGITERTFVSQTILSLPQSLQRISLDEVKFMFGASGHSLTQCREPVNYELISCSTMEMPVHQTLYGEATVEVTSARLSIEVTAVPEPSSLALGLAAVGLLAGLGSLRRVG